MVFLESFSKIISYVEFIDTISLAFAAGAIFISASGKHYQNITDTGFCFTLYYLQSLYCLQAWVCYSIITTQSTEALYGMIIFVGGLPLYYLIKKFM